MLHVLPALGCREPHWTQHGTVDYAIVCYAHERYKGPVEAPWSAENRRLPRPWLLHICMYILLY